VDFVRIKRYTFRREPNLLTDVMYDAKRDVMFTLPAYENPREWVFAAIYHLKMMLLLWAYRLRHPNHV